MRDRLMCLKLICMLACLLLGAATPAPLSSVPEPPAPAVSAPVQQLLDEAMRLYDSGKGEDALAAAGRALDAARAAKDLAGMAQAHRSLALLLEALKRSDEAEAAWSEAVAAWRQAGDGPGQVRVLVEHGRLLVWQQPDEAQKLFVQAMALAQAETQRPLAATVELTSTGMALYGRGRLKEAEQLLRAAQAIVEKRAPGSRVEAAVCASLGTLVRDQGDLASARVYLQQAVTILERLNPGSSDVAGSLNNLGLLCQDQGDLGAAHDYYQRALAITEKRYPQSINVAKGIGNLGSVAHDRGDLTAARRLYQRALAIEEMVAPDSLNVAGSLNSLGTVAYEQGDLASAQDYYRRSLHIREVQAPGSLAVAASFNNLGSVARAQGDTGMVRSFYEQALAIRERQAPDSPAVASSLNSLGTLAYERGDFIAASDYFQRSLLIAEKLAPMSRWASASLHNLGMVSHALRDLPASQRYYQRALTIKEKLAPGSLDVAISLNSLGGVARDQGDLIKAEGIARRAWQLVRRQGSLIAGDEARQAFGTSTAHYSAHLAQYQFARGNTAAAFTTVEEGRAQALQQLLAERNLVERLVPPSLARQYRLAVAKQNQAEKPLERAATAEATARHLLEDRQAASDDETVLDPLRASLSRAQEELQASQSRYTEARMEAERLWGELRGHLRSMLPAPMPLNQARRHLPVDAVFAAFSVGETESLLFLMRRDGPITACRLPLSAKALDQKVRVLRRWATARPGDRASGTRATAGIQAARDPYSHLFPVAAQRILAGAKRLILSPDGVLWNLPFAALVTNPQGERPRFLGLQKPLLYAQSLTTYAQVLGAPRPSRGRLSALVIGNPNYPRGEETMSAAPSPPTRTSLARSISSPSPAGARVPSAGLPGAAGSSDTGERRALRAGGGEWQSLRYAAAEAQAVARLYGTDVKTGSAPTEAWFRQHAGQAGIIHLATHGSYNEVRAMSSGVLLAKPQTRAEESQTRTDGVLQAWEWMSEPELRLQAELVVLSACETGRGEQVRAEGLVGLTRALQVAGARSIVASQWLVNDRSTQVLMEAFHRKLQGRGRLPKDEALQQAMVATWKRWPHPHHWAAFLLTGDPARL
jgi:CHAT domain-containing protein/tetratricopeptide (TPR) repeat protein